MISPIVWCCRKLDLRNLEKSVFTYITLKYNFSGTPDVTQAPKLLNQTYQWVPNPVGKIFDKKSIVECVIKD